LFFALVFLFLFFYLKSFFGGANVSKDKVNHKRVSISSKMSVSSDNNRSFQSSDRLFSKKEKIILIKCLFDKCYIRLSSSSVPLSVVSSVIKQNNYKVLNYNMLNKNYVSFLLSCSNQNLYKYFVLKVSSDDSSSSLSVPTFHNPILDN